MSLSITCTHIRQSWFVRLCCCCCTCCEDPVKEDDPLVILHVGDSDRTIYTVAIVTEQYVLSVVEQLVAFMPRNISLKL